MNRLIMMYLTSVSYKSAKKNCRMESIIYVCNIIINIMKQKTIKKTVTIIAICTLSALCFILKEEKHNLEDLTLSNIEALASGENGSRDCYFAGSLYCNGGYYKYIISR